MEILQIENLSFSYPESDKKALSNINLTVNEGEFVVVCGESGCGKSTLLRLIKSELSPFGKLEGTIKYQGISIDKLDKSKTASEIGFVLQNPDSQIITDKVYHELAFGLESLGYDNAKIKRKVAEMASYFGIEEWYNKSTNELSGGQKQLLNLASVMVTNPKLILLDEPTAQLDPIASNNFINTLHKINKDLGLTVIIVEHNLEEVLSIADKVLILKASSVSYYGSTTGITQYLKQDKTNKIIEALPSATRIFCALNGKGSVPLSVSDCRNYIFKNFKNDIKSISQSPYKHLNNKKIELKNVCFRYDKNSIDILNEVSFSVYENEHLCILGGNGSGKSTTLSIIGGLLKPYYGSVYIDGKKINKLSQKELYESNIAYLPQNPQALFIEDTAKDDLLEVLSIKNIDKVEAQNKIEQISKKLNIEHLFNMHPYDLSGGEMQKVAIAKLLLSEPKILLLDEPTKGVDAFAKNEIGNILRELNKNSITIITVTHDIEFAAKYCDRCGLFFNKELISIATPREFFSQNSFYTTQANKIARDYYNGVILCEDIIKLCKLNSGDIKNEE